MARRIIIPVLLDELKLKLNPLLDIDIELIYAAQKIHNMYYTFTMPYKGGQLISEFSKKIEEFHSRIF
jgi:hypothetical protein